MLTVSLQDRPPSLPAVAGDRVNVTPLPSSASCRRGRRNPHAGLVPVGVAHGYYLAVSQAERIGV
jgi:hypothetical protein